MQWALREYVVRQKKKRYEYINLIQDIKGTRNWRYVHVRFDEIIILKWILDSYAVKLWVGC